MQISTIINVIVPNEIIKAPFLRLGHSVHLTPSPSFCWGGGGGGGGRLSLLTNFQKGVAWHLNIEMGVAGNKGVTFFKGGAVFP